MDYNKIKSIIEGLLFVSGDEGLEAKQIAEIVEIPIDEVEDILYDMQADFKRIQRGIQIMQIGTSYQLTTLPEHTIYYERLASNPSHSTLSQPALETLALIAYKQPVTRAEIEEVRGVKSEKSINTLVSKGLIKEVGRLDGIGRPYLYGTTNEFLDYFGLKNIKDLPPIPENLQIDDEEDIDLFNFNHNLE